MKKFKYKLLSFLILSFISYSTYAVGIPVQGSTGPSAFPYPNNAKLLGGSYSVDVLIDLVSDNAQNAFGDNNLPQGMLRQVDTVDLQGNTVPQVSPLPLGRGMIFMVAGTIYPSGALKDCRLGEACVPTANSIGNWICTGYTLADANAWTPSMNGVPSNFAGRAFNLVTTTFSIADPNKKLYGEFIVSGLEGNGFADTTTTFPLLVIGKGGSFITMFPVINMKSFGFVGNPPTLPNPFGPGLKMRFSYTLKSL